MLIIFRITITKVDRVSWVCTLALVRVCASNRRSYASAETLGKSKRTDTLFDLSYISLFRKNWKSGVFTFCLTIRCHYLFVHGDDSVSGMLQVMQLHVFETTLESTVCFEHLQCN